MPNQNHGTIAHPVSNHNKRIDKIYHKYITHHLINEFIVKFYVDNNFNVHLQANTNNRKAKAIT